MRQAETERLLNVNEVAEMLGLSPKTVYDMVSQGKIPYVKPTRMVLRFRPSDLMEWLEQRTFRPAYRDAE